MADRSGQAHCHPPWLICDARHLIMCLPPVDVEAVAALSPDHGGWDGGRPGSACRPEGQMGSSMSGSRSRAAPYIIAVAGPGDDATKAETDVARQVGRLLAERDVILVCGGLAGVMEAACKGASDWGGLTVGLLPGRDRAAGNPYLSVVLPTGMGELRNGLVAGVCDAIIAIGGSWGTLSEIALAIRIGKPVIMIGGWTIKPPVGERTRNLPRDAASPEEAVNEALRLAARIEGDRT